MPRQPTPLAEAIRKRTSPPSRPSVLVFLRGSSEWIGGDYRFRLQTPMCPGLDIGQLNRRSCGPGQ